MPCKGARPFILAAYRLHRRFLEPVVLAGIVMIGFHPSMKYQIALRLLSGPSSASGTVQSPFPVVNTSRRFEYGRTRMADRMKQITAECGRAWDMTSLRQ